MKARTDIDAAQTEIGLIGREEEKLMGLYLKEAISLDSVKERGDKLRARKTELVALLATADEPPPMLHPAMAHQYRSRIEQLHETLQDDCEEKRMEAAESSARSYRTSC